MADKKYQKSLFIFRRDLRIADNTALIEASKQSDVVIPLFILDPRQVGDSNKYRSDNALQYMFESLQDLAEQFKKKNGHLYIVTGEAAKIVERLIKSENAQAVFVNADYTPFSRKRDEGLQKVCKKHNVIFTAYHDALLIGDPESITIGSGKPYAKYTAFFRKSRLKQVAEPAHVGKVEWYSKTIKGHKKITELKKLLPHANAELKVNGGRAAAEKVLRNIDRYKQYVKERDFPALDATTHLSAAHKFGTVSIRETYYAIRNALGPHSQLIAELYWRDFFTYLAFHFPHVFGKPLYKKYERLAWSHDTKKFTAWCNGKTGFPIVDAGMRQLNTSGWMHNRVRMIVASFLIKDLHINWLEGERYFATQLVDYDPAVNNGNWQWVASTGADAQPYFRIFNPWLQQKKFDAQCEYIKLWVPELRNVPNKAIHTWYEKYTEYKDTEYPEPIVEHGQEKKISLLRYRRAS